MKKIVCKIFLGLIVFCLVYFVITSCFFMRPVEKDILESFKEYKLTLTQIKDLITDDYKRRNPQKFYGKVTYYINGNTKVFYENSSTNNIYMPIKENLYTKFINFQKKYGRYLEAVDVYDDSLRFIFHDGVAMIIFQDTFCIKQYIFSNGDIYRYNLSRLESNWYYARLKGWR